MRGYVKVLESIQQELPVGQEANFDDWAKLIDAKLEAIIANGIVTKVTQ
jgi:hypothetical protein